MTIEAKYYYLYVSQDLKCLLLSTKDRGKGFVYKRTIYYLVKQTNLTNDSLFNEAKKMGLYQIGEEKGEDFEIYPEAFSKTSIIPQKGEEVILPKTYIYLNIFKITKLGAAWESLINEKCYIISSIKNNKYLECTEINGKLVAFTSSKEANEYIKKTGDEGEPTLVYIKLTRKYSSLYFINEGISIKQYTDKEV